VLAAWAWGLIIALAGNSCGADDAVTVPEPLCFVQPDTLDFESVTYGDALSRTLEVMNPGTLPLQVRVLSSSPSFHFATGAAEETLSVAPGDTGRVAVWFEPQILGEVSATLNLDPPACTAVYCLGLAEADSSACAAQPTELDFGNVPVGEEAEDSFRIFNQGLSPLTGSLRPDYCDVFSIVGGGGAYTLLPETSVEVRVRYAPTREGADTCLVRVGCGDVLCLGRGSSSRAWTVDGSGGGDFATIQAGIDAAAPGDTVLVAPGEYVENVNVGNRDIVLRGVRGAAKTTIRGTEPGSPTVLIGAVTRAMVLEGFTITGDCRPDGTGILVAGGAPVIRANTIRDNGCDGVKWGGGLLCYGPRDLEDAPLVEKNRFLDNAAETGGAGLISGSVVFRENYVKGNHCLYNGGGLYVSAGPSHVLVENNEFWENTAAYFGGGIAAWGSSTGSQTDIVGNLMVRNVALGNAAYTMRGSGGSIHASGWAVSVVGNTIVGGQGRWPCDGAAVDVDGTGKTLSVQRNIIAYTKGPGLDCFHNANTDRVRENILFGNSGNTQWCPEHCGKTMSLWNWVVDPLFCDPEADDYRVAPNSPTLSGLLRIGADLGIGCEPVMAAVTVTATADAYVNSGSYADRNFGRNTSSFEAVGRHVEYPESRIGRQYYSFTVPDVVEPFETVVLRIASLDDLAGTPHGTLVTGVSNDWQELTITWNRQPAPESAPLDTVTAICCGNVYFYDVTEYVRGGLQAGEHTFSFVQSAVDESKVGGMSWWMREGQGGEITGHIGEAPELWIDPVVPLRPLPLSPR